MAGPNPYELHSFRELSAVMGRAYIVCRPCRRFVGVGAWLDTLDTRLVTQAAVFTLSSDKKVSFDAFLAKHGLEKALTKFVVAADDVGRLRDQLDLVGMDERRLFPDLDGVAASLRRYYG